MWASVDGRVQDKYAAMQGIGSLSPSELAQNRQLITGLQRPTPAGDSFGQSPARVNKPVVKNDTGVAGTSNVVAGPPNSQPQADFEARRKYTPSPGYGVDGKPLAVPFPTSKEISEFNQKIVDGGLRSVGDGSPNISTKGSMPKIMIKGADGQMRPETLGEEAARVGTAGPSGTGPSGMAQLSAPSVDIANAATRKVTAENRAAEQVASEKSERDRVNADFANRGKPLLPPKPGTVAPLTPTPEQAANGLATGMSVNPAVTPESRVDAGGGEINLSAASPAPIIPGIKPQRINPATGLPMGYRPGDSVDPQFKAKADESVAAQRNASVTGRPLTPIGSQPATPSVSSQLVPGLTKPTAPDANADGRYDWTPKHHGMSAEQIAAENSKRVTMDHLDKWSTLTGKPITQDMKWGIGSDGGQLTMDHPDMAPLKQSMDEQNPAGRVRNRAIAWNAANPKETPLPIN